MEPDKRTILGGNAGIPHETASFVPVEATDSTDECDALRGGTQALSAAKQPIADGSDRQTPQNAGIAPRIGAIHEVQSRHLHALSASILGQ